MLELVIGLLVFIGGVTIGTQHSVKGQLPERWEQEEHSEMVNRCAISCGEGRFLGYKPLTGECKCNLREVSK